MFVVLLTYKKPLADVDRWIPEHRAYLEKNYAAGHFVLSGRQEPRTGGVILATGASRDAVLSIVQQDPFHREAIADYEIIQFLPSMAAPALESLREV